MYTLGTGRILIKSNIIVCLLNLMAWKASWAHRTGENEKKDNDKLKKSVQTTSACAQICTYIVKVRFEGGQVKKSIMHVIIYFNSHKC